jgi:thioredoxin reductase
MNNKNGSTYSPDFLIIGSGLAGLYAANYANQYAEIRKERFAKTRKQMGNRYNSW